MFVLRNAMAISVAPRVSFANAPDGAPEISPIVVSAS
jgi:hypothetical protein